MRKILPNSSFTLESEVVRNLKQLLDENICNCKICSGNVNSFQTYNSNKQVQVRGEDLFSTIGRVSSDPKLIRTHSHNLQKNLFCPGCYMAMNLFRYKDIKFLKDEESETKTEIFCHDKSTEKEINVVEKSTSDTNKVEFKSAAIVSQSQDFSKYSPVAIAVIDNLNINNEVVTSSECQEGTLETKPVNSNCLCMTNFINSIRPPLTNNDIFDIYS